MVKNTATLLLATLSYVAAWPQVMGISRQLQNRDVEPPYRAPAFPDQGRPNTGLSPSGFNAEDQYFDTTDAGPNP
jgi:hypothetical protein